MQAGDVGQTLLRYQNNTIQAMYKRIAQALQDTSETFGKDNRHPQVLQLPFWSALFATEEGKMEQQPLRTNQATNLLSSIHIHSNNITEPTQKSLTRTPDRRALCLPIRIDPLSGLVLLRLRSYSPCYCSSSTLNSVRHAHRAQRTLVPMAHSSVIARCKQRYLLCRDSCYEEISVMQDYLMFLTLGRREPEDVDCTPQPHLHASAPPPLPTDTPLDTHMATAPAEPSMLPPCIGSSASTCSASEAYASGAGAPGSQSVHSSHSVESGDVGVLQGGPQSTANESKMPLPQQLLSSKASAAGRASNRPARPPSRSMPEETYADKVRHSAAVVTFSELRISLWHSLVLQTGLAPCSYRDRVQPCIATGIFCLHSRQRAAACCRGHGRSIHCGCPSIHTAVAQDCLSCPEHQQQHH